MKYPLHYSGAILNSILPNRLLVVALIRRATGLWLCVRLTIGIYAFAMRLDPIFFSGGTALGAVLLTGVLGVTDTIRRGEWVFFGNLALSPAVLCGLFFAPALCGELAMQTIHALVK